VPRHELRVVDDGIQEVVDLSVLLPGEWLLLLRAPWLIT
jgi:hypothetical protein